jgi:GTP cyclohydrolase I|tara:strand:+ start:3707 stop:4387 length:681 start_codon:yes stop_codon:yes gene_type:complete
MEPALMTPLAASAPMISEDAKKVRDVLIARGLETPLVDNGLSRDQKFERIQASFSDIARTLGLDLTDDSLRDTPERISRMYVDEIFSGLDYARFPKATSIANKMQVEEMVRIEGISVVSTCEHHFVTIDGVASVGYIPAGKIIGLSKVNRIVRFFAQRPQVQERLTQQVLVALQTLLETDDVAVAIDAVHYCVKARGVMDANSRTRTTALGGQFKVDARTRGEFLS